MDSIGEKLKTKREEQGYSIDQVARDTNIAKRYLHALEDEDFDSFPGEPYLLGFLRNYSDYLGLNADSMISLYKNFRIQEQPIPMDELLDKKKVSPSMIVIISLLVVVIGGGAFFLNSYLNRDNSSNIANNDTNIIQTKVEEKVEEPEEEALAVYTLNDEIIERRFLQGEKVLIPGLNEEMFIWLKKIEDDILIDNNIELIYIVESW